MIPTLHSNSSLLVKYKFEPKRCDIVIINIDGITDNNYIVKRIIGLPNETVVIHNNKIYINDVLYTEEYSYYGNYVKDYSFTIPSNYYLVLGDNRNTSIDSRVFGLIERERLVGKVIYSRWNIYETNSMVPWSYD